MNQDLFTLLVLLVTLLGGGGITVGGLKFNLPGAPSLKQWLISQRDAQLKLSELKSEHIMTVIYESSQEDLKSPAKLFHASGSALRFYHFAREDKLVGKTAEQLMGILDPWLANKGEFFEDQKRVQADMQAGRKAVAQVPMVINQEHPEPGFRGKAFHPIVAHWSSEKGSRGFQTFYTTVLYIDLSAVPRDQRSTTNGSG